VTRIATPPARLPAATLGKCPGCLADTVGERDLPEGHRVWPRIPGWAGEPGLIAPDAITRAPEPPEKTSNQNM
jgi:hypothetical protein